MARIHSIEQGAYGSVRLRTEAGSLFLFRPEYMPPEGETGGSLCDADASTAAGNVPARGDEVPDEVLAAVDAAVQAEIRALSLLARAEQTRFGLERKLAVKGFAKDAIRKVLDRLESEGLLDDRRYAQAWIGSRLRKGILGPLSLRSGLAAKGIDSRTVRAAMEAVFSGSEREKTLGRVIETLKSNEFRDKSIESLRFRLKSLGYGTVEIDGVLDTMDG